MHIGRKIIDETTECKYDFACLWDNKCHTCARCAIDFADGENVLFLEGKAPQFCPYRTTWGYGEVCRCPTNYALHNTRLTKEGKNMHVGVWIADENDVIINTNRRMESIAGISHEHIVGVCVRTGFHDETVRFFLPHYEKTKETHQSRRYEHIPVATPAGRRSYQSGWLIPKVRDEKVVRMICTVEDVTNAMH